MVNMGTTKQIGPQIRSEKLPPMAGKFSLCFSRSLSHKKDKSMCLPILNLVLKVGEAVVWPFFPSLGSIF